MLNRIVELSLRHRGVVVALAALLLVAGGTAAFRAPLDVFPDFVPPQVVVQTEAPGFSAEQVEQLVTYPLEAELGGVLGLESLRSESIQGLSVITATFRDGTPVLALRQGLAERLARAGTRLPQGVGPPGMEPLTSSTMDVLKIGLVSDAVPPAELRELADFTVVPRLLAVPGVARANVFGGEVRQLQIQVRTEAMLAHRVALADVVTAARRATGVVGAGFVDTPNQRVVLESEGQALDAATLGGVAIASAATGPVRLREVADVLEGAAPRFGDAIIQGRPGVLVTLSSQYGANTLQVTRGLERALHDLAPLFAARGIDLYPRLHRPASFIEHALRNLRFSLLLGAALVVTVLFAFLGHVRTAVISLAAIPLSLLGAVLVLERLGITINTMTLGGLAIALGEVVDDAVIDVENIVRRLRENRARRAPRPPLRVVLDASLEVRGVVVYATSVVALIFLPLLTLSGLAGSFFAPLGLAYLLAVGVSLAVALTVTPALSLLFLGGGGAESPPRLQGWLKARYRSFLSARMGRPAPPIVGAAVLALAALAALPLLGGGFLPQFREGHLVLQVSEAPGASLDELLRVGRSLSDALLAIPGIATVEQQVGRAEQGEDTWGPNRSELHVELDPAALDREAQVTAQVEALLASTPGLQAEVLTFLGDRISETLTGETAPVVLNLFGTDLAALDATAARIARVLATVPGASEVRVKAPPGAPTLAIALRPERLAEFGFLPVDVLEAVHTAYQGEVVAQVHHPNHAEDVVVTLQASERTAPDSIGQLLVRSASGALLPLGELADLTAGEGRLVILHEGGRRRQTITCVPRGRDVAPFVADAERTLRAGVDLPPGTYLEFGGTAQAQAAAERELLLDCGMAGLGILVLLWLAFRNARSVALVLANVPFGLVGGVLAVAAISWLGAESAGLSMGSLVGFVTLFGITMRNSIMLISHYQHLVDAEGETWGLDAAVRGATDRVVPILMTALVTGLGLLPLALGAGSAGREIEGPMAIVILGGLASSTALNLLVLPPLALRFGRFARRAEEATVG
jgi:CzcA family heavy metal efflux pump